MSEAKVTFGSDIKELERNNAKLVKDNARITESYRKLKQEAGGSGDAWTKQLKKTSDANDKWLAGLRKIESTQIKIDYGKAAMSGATTSQLGLLAATSKYIPQLAAVTAGLGAAGMAVSYLKTQYSAFRMELEQSTQAHREFQQRLTKDISVSRDAMQGAAVERFVQSVPGVKKEDVRASLAGVTRETPTGTLQRRMEIAGQVARLAPTGQDLGEVGGVAGQLADIMPGVSGKGAAQRAALLVREAGGDIGKLQKDKMQRSLQQLMAKGMPADEALAMGLAAAQGQISPETLTHIAVGGKLSKDQQLEKSRMTPELLKKNLEMIQGTDRTDVIGGILTGMKGTSAGRGAIARSTFSASRESAEDLQTRREELFQQVDEFVRAKHAGKGFGPWVGSEASITMSQFGRTVFGGPANQEQVKGLEIIVAKLQQSMERNAAAVEASNEMKKSKVNIDGHVEP